ncbi:uncharacterized protein LOC130629097 isoform X2 [Hydractinia symbiolongicarpus]|uniref:uncharacterized protein LOC130629097 isoform X2 n=1 Tax=Hydractinia symbiolongicarpus TaxID=13093 RepID=UPI002550BA8C|nr:uncharacterized protein LOC130629097 isoform X2 [Hydractinia symbiolongicarpus]
MKDVKKIFPIVSLSHISSTYLKNDDTLDEQFYKDPKVKALSQEIINAFSEWGFLYLVDHGIDSSVIENAFGTSKEFFEKDRLVKELFIHEDRNVELGYVPFNTETFDKSRPFDLKECFDFLPATDQKDKLTEKFPSLMKALANLFQSLELLNKFFLPLLSIALKPDDGEFLSLNHHRIGNMEENVTVLRSLYYPPIKCKENVLENQLRCGEHSDYGTFTFLFQDEIGGLQVVNPSGEYVNATPIPGSIVVNAGDLLEIWSSDKNTDVSCLDGSDKYKPINAFDYVMKKFEETYG